MVNRLIIAAAGSGKTTYLVKQAMRQSDSVLITTYTIANELEIRKKFVELNGCVPHNVTIQTWYSFLLQHGVRPFQGVVLDDKINDWGFNREVGSGGHVFFSSGYLMGHVGPVLEEDMPFENNEDLIDIANEINNKDLKVIKPNK